MKNEKLFSKNRNELLMKIKLIVNDESIQEDVRGYFKKWQEWYNQNENLLELNDLSETCEFYRAYYHSGIYGIQIWELKDDNLISWKRNIYVSEPDILDDSNTVVLNRTCI